MHRNRICLWPRNCWAVCISGPISLASLFQNRCSIYWNWREKFDLQLWYYVFWHLRLLRRLDSLLNLNLKICVIQTRILWLSSIVSCSCGTFEKIKILKKGKFKKKRAAQKKNKKIKSACILCVPCDLVYDLLAWTILEIRLGQQLRQVLGTLIHLYYLLSTFVPPHHYIWPPKAPHISRLEQVLLCNHTHVLSVITPATVCHL
jgi:hypothetical protein